MHLLHQVAHLIEGDHTQLRFRPHPLDIRMERLADSAAARAAVATVERVAGPASSRLQAIHCLRQRPRHRLQWIEVATAEKVSMRQAPAVQAALQQ